MSLKEKLQVVLNQKGNFVCPNGKASVKSGEAPAPSKAAQTAQSSDAPKLEAVITNLKQRAKTTPATLDALARLIGSLFQKRITDHEIKVIIGELQSKGVITIEAGKVSYHLS